MKYNYLKVCPLILAAALTFSGCAATTVAAKTSSSIASQAATEAQSSATAASSTAASSTTAGTAAASITASTSTDTTTEKTYFTTKDLSGDYDAENAVDITLNGSSATASDSSSVSISGSTITITKAGTYVVSGNLSNGSIIVNANKEDKIQIVLNGVTINSNTFAAIYVAQADKVYVTLAAGTTNTLSNGGTFTPIDDSDVDAVVYAKDDITFNGTGSLTIKSPAGHGIVGKDDVTITMGTYDITAEKTAIKAKDNLDIADGSFTINAGSDGLHAENNDDDSLGAVYIAGGTFNITAGDDGIHAVTTLTIDGGTFTINAAEGLEATLVTINDGTITINASDDGINASQKTTKLGTPTIEINGGNIKIVMGSGDTDGVDANGNIIVNGGTIDVTGTSTFDYDVSGVINGGTVIVNGQQVTTMPSQSMGGKGTMGGNAANGGMTGGMTGGRTKSY